MIGPLTVRYSINCVPLLMSLCVEKFDTILDKYSRFSNRMYALTRGVRLFTPRLFTPPPPPPPTFYPPSFYPRLFTPTTFYPYDFLPPYTIYKYSI